MKTFYNSFLFAVLIMLGFESNAQEVKFNVTKFDPIEKIGTVNVSDIEDK